MMSERLWFKIGEAAEIIGVSPRELRYWEKVISELRPRRSVGNLRYYHKDDLPKLLAIAAWVKQGFTVADCGELLQTGYITRDLGLDLDMEDYDAQSKKETVAKTRSATKPKPGPAPEKPARMHRESMKYDVSTLPPQQLQNIIDSLKKLLSRLQKPAS